MTFHTHLRTHLSWRIGGMAALCALVLSLIALPLQAHGAASNANTCQLAMACNTSSTFNLTIRTLLATIQIFLRI